MSNNVKDIDMVKDIDIKNRTYYVCDDIIHIKMLI